ncbi:MAG: hypothetical protein CL677_09015 [Bdellovibrionaceae bacterium]|nr:hypothetical protein [Pseudobdellovibrionaceae bacterium]
MYQLIVFQILFLISLSTQTLAYPPNPSYTITVPLEKFTAALVDEYRVSAWEDLRQELLARGSYGEILDLHFVAKESGEHLATLTVEVFVEEKSSTLIRYFPEKTINVDKRFWSESVVDYSVSIEKKFLDQRLSKYGFDLERSTLVFVDFPSNEVLGAVEVSRSIKGHRKDSYANSKTLIREIYPLDFSEAEQPNWLSKLSCVKLFN